MLWQKWNGTYYESTTLRDISLRIQLGHSPLSRCCSPEPAFDDKFVVINTSGIQMFSLDFCNCEQELSHFQQLLHMSWFPTMSMHSHSAATFRILKQFHIVSLEPKISTYEYYSTLSRLVDNAGLLEVKVMHYFICMYVGLSANIITESLWGIP